MLLKDLARLLALQLRDLDLPQPVLVALFEPHVVVSLIHEHERVRHLVLELDNDGLLLLDVVLDEFHLPFRGADVHQLLVARLLLPDQFLLPALLLRLLLGKLDLEVVQVLDRGRCGHLEPDQFQVALVDVLDVLLVLNL